MNLEEELLGFLKNSRKPPTLKLDGTPRKQRKIDPTLQQRNVEIILSHFGFGEEAWPTLDYLAQRHDGLTRERVRQIIERNYTEHLPSSPLAAAEAAARVVEERAVWTEDGLLSALCERGLIGDLKHAVGLLSYLQSQGLVDDYEVYLPSLQQVTRGSYLEAEGHLVATATYVTEMQKNLQAAQKLPGRQGIAQLSKVSRRGAAVDYEGLKDLIMLSPHTWSGIHEGELWYSFEDRENVLVNEASKAFAIAGTISQDDLATLLSQALKKRSAKFSYPPVELISTWITQSIHFSVEDRLVTFNGEIAGLNPIEKAIAKHAHRKPGILLTDLSEQLISEGFGSANGYKNLYGSPLLLIDKSSGRKGYKATLISEVGARPRRTDTQYERCLARLAKLAGTDRDIATTTRIEQSILRDWIFQDTDKSECAACGRTFAKGGIVAAHKKKRKDCSDSERLDPHIVFPLCVFGCDHLYEHGYITVREGYVCPGNDAPGPTERSCVENLLGRSVPARWLLGPQSYFDNV